MELNAYAKINLGLNIKYKRHDGYHELESIMVLTSLHDILRFESSDTIEVSTHQIIAAKDNIIFQIAQYLKEEYAIDRGVKITLEKNIPISAGLAGGSTDAATTIKALNEFWNLNLSMEKMLEIGKKFGADIPFCLFSKPAFVRGIGENLEAIDVKMDFSVIIVKMPFFVSTVEVFNNLEVKNMDLYNLKYVKEALETSNKEELIANLGNNMEYYTCNKYPEIEEVKKLLIENGCFISVMSGSGPTVLGLIDKNKEQCLEKIKSAGYQAWLTEILK